MVIFISMALMSCNEKTDTIPLDASSSVAVTAFRLEDDIKVMDDLSEVFFSIDLEKRIIFNADSLPLGTDVSKLVPTITYPSSVRAAVITMTGGKVREGEVDYKSNPKDSIDFTGNVDLTLTAENGVTQRTYRLKVNVHNCKPDSLVWDKVALGKLPSRMDNPLVQKSVADGSGLFMIIEENDHSYTFSSTEDVYADDWQIEAVSLPAGTQVRTFTLADGVFYILDGDGNLMESADGLTWSATGETWVNVLGAFNGAVLGIKSDTAGLTHCHYPSSVSIEDEPVAADFPMSGFSNMCVSQTEWSDDPTAIIVGGRLADGTVTDATWAYDGSSWMKVTDRGLPPITGCTLVPYYTYRQVSDAWIQTEFKVWMVIGGELEDGSLNRKSYLSYTNGVSWRQGDTLIELPEYIPGMIGVDNVVIATEMDSYLSDAWQSMPPRDLPPFCRLAYQVEGYYVTWDCPYIYLLGGTDQEGKLYNTIWRGVLSRLTFTPLF